MKKCLSLVLITLLGIFLFNACEEEPTKSETPEVSTAIYVLNSAATSISVIDLETDTVYNDVATVGTWPNQLVYKDEKLYCVNSGSNNIMVFSVADWSSETPIALGDGNNPMNMLFFDDNYAYVTCSMSNKVLKVDIADKSVEKEINAGVGATGIAMAGNKVYVSNTGYNGWGNPYLQGTVSVIDGATGDLLTTINVGTNPQSIAVAPDGKLHVSCTGDYATTMGVISIIDPATDEVVHTIDIGGSPGMIAISDVDNLAFLTVWGMGCMVYNTETYEVVHDANNMFLGKGGSGVLIDTEGNIWVSVWADDQVVKVSGDGTILATYNVGDSPMSLAMKVE